MGRGESFLPILFMQFIRQTEMIERRQSMMQIIIILALLTFAFNVLA